jgi:hypothetical protein
MIRAAQPLGACPGGRAPRQNWGKFEAHKWGGFTGRLDMVIEIDSTALPLGVLIGLVRQQRERRIELLEQFAPTSSPTP